MALCSQLMPPTRPPPWTARPRRSVHLAGLERARRRGRLLGLASVEILLAGVAVTVQGIRIIYEPDGSLLVQPPRFRHPDGRWLPVVILPPKLASAIAAEVLDTFQDVSN